MFDAHAMQVLEYPQVLDRVAASSHWAPGREQALTWQPLDDARLIRRRQGEVREMRGLLDVGGLPTPGGLLDPRPLLGMAERGATLTALDLIAVRAFAGFFEQAVKFYRQHPRAPQLAERVVGLQPAPRVEAEIAKAIAPDATVLDRASARLLHLRQEVRRLESGVQERLHRLLRQPEINRMLQDSLVTSRSGRWVVPVKATHRTLFPGLFIDQSASGATIFMEPFEVIEAGNQLRAALLAEEQEVQAILSRLSGIVAFHAPDLQAGVEAFGHLDAVMAVASYGRDLGARLPTVGESRRLALLEARHPLLVEKLGSGVVPISVDLDRHHTVVVTGPNTGGKTVALRTVGLLALMALAGLPIPASSDSCVPVLSSVFADIGDEQGIAQSLSTFSSHLTQILRILPHSNDKTLVLLDEVGAGTDPAEGAALGQALLQWLHDRQGYTMVTTHLSDLKSLADTVPGMTNAAVEFDIDTLRPTYRLTLGVAGRSNALQIARRLGLPEDILAQARRFLGQGSDTVNRLLSDLELEREATQAHDARLRDERARVARQAHDLDRTRDEVASQRASVLQEARRQGEAAVLAVRDQAHEALRDTRRQLTDLEAKRREALSNTETLALELAAALATALEDPTVVSSLSDAASERLAVALQRIADRLWGEALEEEVATEETDDLESEARLVGRTTDNRLQELQRVLDELAPERLSKSDGTALQPGQPVYVHSFGQEGTVVKSGGGRVEVQVGSVRLKVRRDEVEPV